MAREMGHDRFAVILVGHGGIASTTPREFVNEFRSLERERLTRGETAPGGRESELDRIIRSWERTPDTDPYKFGLEELVVALKRELGTVRILAAFNEFCAPSVDEAIDSLAAEGFPRIRVLTTMLTRGGSHSEKDIPATLERGRKRHPDVRIEYVWPLDPTRIARFISDYLRSTTR